MASFPIRVRAVPRDQLPTDDDLRTRLVRLVRDGLREGRGAPAVIVVRERTVDQVDPTSALEGGVPIPALIAAMAGSSTLPGGVAVAVGIAGRLTFRPEGGEPHPVATVFLEWSDNRWWHWQARVDAEGAIVEGSAVVRAAEAGQPLPDGLGRWWSEARRRGLRCQLAPIVPAGDGGVEH
jgi:hypothetical protein